MANNINSNVVDQPAKAGEDKLEMRAYADALTEFIRNAQSPLTIALQGEWGSGKTSLMKSIEANLTTTGEKGKPTKDAPFFGIWINTWQYALMANPDEAILKILTSIIGQVAVFANTKKEDCIKIFCKIARVGGGVISDLFKKASGVDLEKNIMKLVESGAAPTQSDIEDLKKELSGLVEKAIGATTPRKKGFLFFIDDLDRIDPPVAVQILELLKNIFDLENCIFVLAIDYGVVVKGLKPKFGAMTTENEREFRSFFDKIIQLPFAMPVNSYKIDQFLIRSLQNVGYLSEKDGYADDRKETPPGNKQLCDDLTSYALLSVGSNPRSIKRLINSLSLIRLVIQKTTTQDDNKLFDEWKDVLFALECLKIQYPKIYSALSKDQDFSDWGEPFAQKMQLKPLENGEAEKLKSMAEFDENWEQVLLRFCRTDSFLSAQAPNVSKMLNRIRERIEKEKEKVGDIIKALMDISAVTTVKSEPEQTATPDFDAGGMLKGLRQYTLGLEHISGTKGWETMLADRVYLSTWQGRVQSGLSTELWIDKRTHDDGTDDGFLTEPQFHIFHDGRSFQLKINGETWGNWPQEKYKGIDFASNSKGVAEVEVAYCDAWKPFGIKGEPGLNVGHSEGNDIGADDMWWNITIPFKDYEELVSKDFSHKLRKALSDVADAFAALLQYRVSVNP